MKADMWANIGRPSILYAAAHHIDGLPMFAHISAFIWDTPLTSCATNCNSCVQLFGRGGSFIPQDDLCIGLFTPWSLNSPLGRQGPSCCATHALGYCSIQKICLCWPLQLEPTSTGIAA